MKRLLSLFVVLLFVISLSTYNVSAEEKNHNEVFCSAAFVAEADCRVEQLESGENMIILSKTQALAQVGTIQNYEVTTVAIYPDSEGEVTRLIEDISSIKQVAATRGSGSYTDEGLFHGDSVCVKSTLNYYTTQSGGLQFGGITSVYVACSVSNRTILDDISLSVHQGGFTANDGWKTYDKAYDINNWSTTTPPSSWLPVLWNNGVSSLVGAKVTVIVHRGTSRQYTYTFTNNLIE